MLCSNVPRLHGLFDVEYANELSELFIRMFVVVIVFPTLSLSLSLTYFFAQRARAHSRSRYSFIVVFLSYV